MKTNLKALASLVLALSLQAANAQTAASPSSSSSTPKKTHKAKAPTGPSVQSQIDALRTEMQGQIQTLQQQLSQKDAQLQQAQQAAAAAQAAAQQAQQAAQAAQTANSENTQAVTSLQGAVTDLKTSNTTLTQSVDAAKKQAAMAEKPDVFRYKGITITPAGSYLAAETVWRSSATGGGLPTAFSALPFASADGAKLSEFYGTGRQSRIALLAEGKAANLNVRGYYEADFLGTGITSNNNQSNSYVLRQRQVWAQAELPTKGLTITGGQMWSLATEYKPGSGLVPGKENSPQTIDPNYVPGFNWARQWGFRVSKTLPHTLTLAASLENPETLNLGGTVPANILIGSAGTGGGNYNSTANYSFNLAPDIIAKLSLDPKFGGHYEIYGLGRFFQSRVYAGYKSTSTYNPVTGVTTTTTTYTNAYNDSTVGGGIGGSLRYQALQKKVDIGFKGLWGDGISRYGATTLPDATASAIGQFQLLHGYSALATLEAHATKRLDLYFNYGTDGVFRRYSYSATGSPYGYGNYSFVNTGCDTEVAPGGSFTPSNPSKCAGNTRDVQEFTFGYWYDFYKGPMGRLRQGFQYAYATRNAFSGVGPTPQATDNMFWTSFRYYLP
jgi:hypothetical protein